MCISISEANTICISVHSQWYDTLKIHMKQLEMRCDSPLLQCSAIRFRLNSIQFDSMQWKKYNHFYIFGSDRQQIINLLMFLLVSEKRPWGMFHKIRLISVSLIPCQIIWFYKANLTKINSSLTTRVSTLLTAKLIYLHDFQTFTDEKYTRDMSVMHWGKQNISNALNRTNIFAVCRGGSIWSMIDIKGCLRISVHILVRLCELTLSFITALALIDLLGYFKSGFGL